MPIRPSVFPTVLVIILAVPAALAPSVAADHEYEQTVNFEWDTTELDVIVLGVDDPFIGAAIREGIDAWRVGVQQLGPAWLADSLVLRVHLPSLDASPPPDFETDDIEIYLVAQGFFAVDPCETLRDCPTGQWCIATAPRLMAGYTVTVHEFGHCLGLGHVFNHGVEYSPREDVMGLAYARNNKACPSNLNMLGLQQVFGGLFGLEAAETVNLPASSYVQASC